MAKINKTNWTRPAAKLKTNVTTEEDEKVIAEYLFFFNARFDMDTKDSEDVRDILRQLIAEVKKPNIFDKINQTNWGQER